MSKVQEKEFSKEEEIFIEYLATPSKQRGTQKDLAAELGLSGKTLSEWKKRPEIVEAAYQKKVQLVKASDTPEIIDALVREAKTGSIQHIKLFKEWFYDTGLRGKSMQQINISFQDVPRPEENTIDVDYKDD